MSINFKGIESAGVAGFSLTDQILTNLKFWIDHNLLIHGGFDIYKIGQDSFFSNDEANLKYVPDARFPDRTVFESVGRGFVWESGITPVNGDTPFRPSGVYINGNFVPSSSTGPDRFHIDSLNGRIIFDESRNANDIVSANYCSRAVYTGFSDSSEFSNIMLESIEEFLSGKTPSATPSKEHQVWLPAIFVEVQSGKVLRGLQLGGGQVKEKIIVLHIFANDSGYRNMLLDILDFQNRAAFWLGDTNKIPQMFDEFGDVLPGITNWVDLASQFPYRKLRITDGSCKTINSLNTKLFRGQVRWVCEIDLGGI